MTQTLNADPVQRPPSSELVRRSPRAGLIYGLSAYGMWGFIALYFHALSNVQPLIILYHRIIWSALFMVLVVSVRGEWKSIWPALRQSRNVLMLCAGAVLIAVNWLLFIYAIATKQL